MKEIIKSKNKLSTPATGRGGFTLIEMLVAVTIFTFSLLGMLVIMGGNISDVTLAKNRITASYLAQEGLEAMRNLRDTRALYDSNSWNAFIIDIDPCFNDDACYIDPVSQAIMGCFEGVCPTLKYSDSSGYNYASPESSGFTRTIEVQNSGGNPDQIEVFSRVYWYRNNDLHEVVFSEVLFNWIKAI